MVQVHGRLVVLIPSPCHLSDYLAGNQTLVFRSEVGGFLGSARTTPATWVGLPGGGTNAPTAGNCRQTSRFRIRLPLAGAYVARYQDGVPVWHRSLRELRGDTFRWTLRMGSTR